MGGVRNCTGTGTQPYKTHKGTVDLRAQCPERGVLGRDPFLRMGGEAPEVTPVASA